MYEDKHIPPSERDELMGLVTGPDRTVGGGLHCEDQGVVGHQLGLDAHALAVARRRQAAVALAPDIQLPGVPDLQVGQVHSTVRDSPGPTVSDSIPGVGGAASAGDPVRSQPASTNRTAAASQIRLNWGLVPNSKSSEGLCIYGSYI